MSAQWPAQALELRTRDAVTQREWNHVAVVSDGTGKALGVTIYLNGLAVPTEVVKDTLSGSINNTAEVQIGRKKRTRSLLSEIWTTCVSIRARSQLLKSTGQACIIRSRPFFQV